MGKTIVITSGKGGVGKTTSTANIGYALASIGNKVLLIDADNGLRNLDVALGVENKIIYDVIDVISSNCRLVQALIRINKDISLYLLPAAQGTDLSVDRDKLKLFIKSAASEFDYVIIDSPAGIENGFMDAVFAADAALLTVVPEISSVRDADRVSNLLINMGIKERYLLVNRYRETLSRKGGAMNPLEIAETLSIPLLGIIPEDESVIRNGNVGELVVKDKRSKSGKAFTETAERIYLGNVIRIRRRRSVARRIFAGIGL